MKSSVGKFFNGLSSSMLRWGGRGSRSSAPPSGSGLQVNSSGGDQLDGHMHMMAAADAYSMSDRVSSEPNPPRHRGRGAFQEPPPPHTEQVEDQVVYSKNNIDFKLSLPNSTISDSQVPVPGFLFIKTRGSDFGSTLILNWVPNSSLLKRQQLTVASEGEEPLLSTSRAEGRGGGGGGGGGGGEGGGGRGCAASVSIDLSQTEMIRVFFEESVSKKEVIASGEMVLTSRDRSYYMFYFRNGGLSQLVDVLRSWSHLGHQDLREARQHTFTIIQPKLRLSELHPQERRVKSCMTDSLWASLMDQDGRITEGIARKVIFFQGVAPPMRKEVWPFLLGLYRFDSTGEQRRELWHMRHKEYWDINTQRNILLNYLIHNGDVSYSQGMTDLLAPVLVSLNDEAEAFWCFTSLVESSAFFKPARNHVSVDKQLEPLRMLIKLLLPWFFRYLEETEGGLTLMFCHRWLLVCLKREFREEDAVSIWEVCWSEYETKAFHLFLCIAIMAIYGSKAIEKNMNINELMVFFSTLSCTMPKDLILAQARGYLFQFRRSPEVHCSLYPLMDRSFWDLKESPHLGCEFCRGRRPCERLQMMERNDVDATREYMC